MTWSRAQFLEAISETAIWTPDYAEDVLVRLAHNSSAIEGNTFTLSDTFSLLIDERTPLTSKPVREMYEVSNHREALALILMAICDGASLSEQLVQNLHAALMDHLINEPGSYKSSENAVRGASWVPTPPSLVPIRMREWVSQVEWQTANLEGEHLLEAIARSHIDFERIHPFADGNGRTGRAIIAYQAIRRFGVPAIIEATARPQYLALLETQDATGLAEMLAASIALEQTRPPLFA